MKLALMAFTGCFLAAGIASAQEHGGKVDWVRSEEHTSELQSQ